MRSGRGGQSKPPVRWLAALMRRHAFVLVSLAAHALLIALLYYFGAYQVELSRQREQVSAGAELTRQSGIEKRVLDMEKIKDLLDQSRPDAPPRDGAGAADEPDFRATSLPKQPEQLLAQARELSASIAAIENELKAAELARIEGISKEQARKRLAPPPGATPPPGAAPKQLAEEIQQLETKARSALLARQQDLDQRQNGVAIKNGRENSQDERGQAKDSGSRQGAPLAGAGNEQGDDRRAGSASGIDKKDVAQRMAAFINRDVALPANAAGDYNRSGEVIFNGGRGSVPPVDAGAMHKGTGRMLGQGGEFANRVYVNSWYLIGPFDGKHGRELFSNHSYPPEQGVVLDAVYFGKGNRLLKWRYVTADSYPLVPPDLEEDAVYYGYTELTVDRDQELTLWMGADDDAQVWLNDRQVWVGGNVNKAWFWRTLYDTPNTYGRDFNTSEGKRKVRFRKGRNKLFFKMANGPSRGFFSLVITK